MNQKGVWSGFERQLKRRTEREKGIKTAPSPTQKKVFSLLYVSCVL